VFEDSGPGVFGILMELRSVRLFVFDLRAFGVFCKAIGKFLMLYYCELLITPSGLVLDFTSKDS
jgi:hypothetical protein